MTGKVDIKKIEVYNKENHERLKANEFKCLCTVNEVDCICDEFKNLNETGIPCKCKVYIKS